MPYDMTIWTTELRRGVVELCILAVLQRNESYGYEIVERLSHEAKLPMTESTVYPILTRLQRDGLLSSRMQRSGTGPPRRYFRLTAEGRLRFQQMVREWKQLQELVGKLLESVDVENPNGGSS
ncbi:MAG: PadR family transcriptional regulator [Gemmataceae bacterium]